MVQSVQLRLFLPPYSFILGSMKKSVPYVVRFFVPKNFSCAKCSIHIDGVNIDML